MIRKDGRIKLLDFGAARIIGPVSRSLSVIIRPGYTPIEQYSEKRPQGPYTDIFALCGTLYYMLTGSTPESLYERMTKRADLKRPSELGADIEPAQESAVLMGLEVNPEDRFQKVDELRNALLNAKGGLETNIKKARVRPIPTLRSETENRNMLPRASAIPSSRTTIPLHSGSRSDIASNNKSKIKYPPHNITSKTGGEEFGLYMYFHIS